MKSITFLFPHPVSGPTGGYKVVYEYANRLINDDWQVEVVYAGSIYWKQKPLRLKLSNIVRQMQYHIKGFGCRNWFPLDEKVKERLTFSLNYRHVPHTQFYVATSPYTAYYLNEYPIETKRKFYLIQDYEDWGPGLKKILTDTYHYPMQKLVIATWLQKMLRERHNEDSILLPNGFDFTKFSLDISIEEKNSLRVSMLYHLMERKDCKTGFQALSIVKEQYPDLRVNLFGTPVRPKELPDWYTYYQLPDEATHNRINNEAAVYIGTSQTEGWGLTVGEAMICGQAVCCTDNDGYREMAIDGVTALVSPIRDAEAMAANIIRLIKDDELRIKIARHGHEYIRRFTWDKSFERLKRILENETCLL